MSKRGATGREGENGGGGDNEEGWEAAREETSVPASYMQMAAAALRLGGCDDKTVAHSEAPFDLKSLKIERPRLPPGTRAAALPSRRPSRRLLIAAATVAQCVCLFIFKHSFKTQKKAQ